MKSLAKDIVWTDYMRYRARLRGFDLDKMERIVRYTGERYVDTATNRRVAVGRHGKTLVAIPYEIEGSAVTPITVHATTRQQVSFRVRVGRFIHE
jgi:hypothetical protein